MNMDCFIKRFSDVLLNDKNDDTFQMIKMLAGGTTSTRIGKLLNFAVSQIEPNECYVEVGVFNGATLCSAAYVNGQKCIGIDRYDVDQIKFMTAVPASDIRDRCLHNIRNLAPNTKLIEKDFRDVTQEEIGCPVAVSFIDGTHDYEDVTRNLEWLEPMLADEAILVFDDINYEQVSRAVFDWIKTHSDHYELLAYIKPFFFDSAYTSSVTERFLNNGVGVVRYHKNEKINFWTYSIKN